MSPESSTQNTKVCPTCGTRLNENATRCLVCGRNFSQTTSTSSSSKGVQGPRMPELTLSLPVVLVLIVLVMAIGAGAVYGVMRSTGKVVEPTITITPTTTATLTLTPTATLTPTNIPTFTALPPIEYTVRANDTCISIAYAFKVSVLSIVTLNNLPAECNALSVGQKLQIPQPTITPSPLPTSTLNAADATEAACDKLEYTVKANDTLGGIAANYNVSTDAIRVYNSLPNDIVYEGEILVIPLCARLPTAGPTPTATPPPPYPAPNLLLPADGTAFMSSNDVITLQWASVGTLRSNEAYAVNIEDLTDGTGRKLVDYVTDTKYIVPSSFRPVGNVPHVIRWVIYAVRQTGTSKDGEPIWETGGATSMPRVFSWWGGSVTTTPTPGP
jgi:LysM repeat protein